MFPPMYQYISSSIPLVLQTHKTLTHTLIHTKINTFINKEPKTADSNDIKPDGEETVDDIWPTEDDTQPATAQSKVEPDKATERAKTDKVEVVRFVRIEIS